MWQLVRRDSMWWVWACGEGHVVVTLCGDESMYVMVDSYVVVDRAKPEVRHGEGMWW